MPPEIISYIASYGYLAIFILVLSQEVGVPNPVPNEFVLLFSGYLSFTGVLHLPLIILTVASADFTGTCILYFTFYFFGHYIIQHKPRWLPLSDTTINKYSTRISKGGLWAIFIGRLTPFIRGYTSAFTGLLQIKPKVFLPIALVTGTSWGSAYIIAGRILSPWWIKSGIKIHHPAYFLVGILLISILVLAIKALAGRIRFKKKMIQSISNG